MNRRSSAPGHAQEDNLWEWWDQGLGAECRGERRGRFMWPLAKASARDDSTSLQTTDRGSPANRRSRRWVCAVGDPIANWAT